ncbi:MAG: sulfatase-like hydrolase/transferase, partial [Akkermansiaceae bacterium]
MKSFWKTGNCVALLMLLTGGLRAAQPNIVLFFSDDHTQQVISAYQDLPNAKLQDLTLKDWLPSRAPNLDRLATNGVVFANSYVSNSLCGPSRANLMTGLHSHANGFTSNRGEVFDGRQQNFAKLLGAAGYATSLFGKWHLVSEPTGFSHYERLVGQGAYYSPVLRTTLEGGGRSDVRYSGRYVSEVLTEQALDWLEDHVEENPDQPFMMMVNHKATHRVWQPSPIELQPETFRQVEWDYSVTPNPDTAPG